MDLIGKWIKFEMRGVSGKIHYHCHKVGTKQGILYVLVKDVIKHQTHIELVSSQSIMKYGNSTRQRFYTASNTGGNFNIQYEFMITTVKSIKTTMRKIIRETFK